MAAIDRTPDNPNMLNPNGFLLVVKKLPHVVWGAQEINLPGITLPSVQTGNPFLTLPHEGDHMTFEPLRMTFKVDENLQNWTEIQNWMRGMGFPENYEQYADLRAVPNSSGLGMRSDISLLITNSNKVPTHDIVFRECFPTSLTGLQFGTKSPDILFMNATVTFAYIMYDINSLI
jgi:hypothetical protein